VWLEVHAWAGLFWRLDTGRPPRDHDVVTHDEDRAACAASVDAGLFEQKLGELGAVLAPVFARREPRRNAGLYLRGLLAPGERKTCWGLAQAVGLARPYGVQHLLGEAVWDEDAARDAVRAFVVRHLGAAGGVLVFDETGQLKKGAKTAGVGRRYTGTAGRVENAIVAVYCTYATALGHALIDRDLYVQRAWFADPGRMAEAGFPEGHAFATKPELAKAQAERALAAGIEPGWAAGDEVYGRSGELRGYFEQRGIGYVFAVGVDHHITLPPGTRLRADRTLNLVPAHAGNRVSCGRGAKGPRYYDWAQIATASPRHHLLIRRSIGNPQEIAYFYAYVPEHRACTLAALAKIAGIRWTVEDDFQDSKQTVGLDHTQVRRYRAWKRHATLAMAAHALLSVIAALQKAGHPTPLLPHGPHDTPPADCGQIALTVPEAQRLFHLYTELTHDLPCCSDEPINLPSRMFGAGCTPNARPAVQIIEWGE
jgi:SRSO17 transposase